MKVVLKAFYLRVYTVQPDGNEITFKVPIKFVQRGATARKLPKGGWMGGKGRTGANE